jgi:uncharacterized protein YbjQ (UPF0145 family)
MSDINAAINALTHDRLAATAGVAPGAPFTSDLSVSEYLLLKESGFEPLGLVLGTSIYHVGIQVGRWNVSQELGVLTQAMYNGRDLAMDRMVEEADQLGADGIVGVNLEMKMYAWGEDVYEFLAVGTAVRAIGGEPGAHRAPNGKPFTSDLSAQDFYRLLFTGSIPVSFVFGNCVFHVAHQGIMQSLRQAGRNVEMPQFTQAVYTARELALGRMQAESMRAQSNGVVGVRSHVANHVWGSHATEFFSLGTAIRTSPQPRDLPHPSLVLGLDT